MAMLRLIVKRTVQAAALVLTFPAALLTGFGRIQPCFEFFSQTFAAYPGAPGNLLRTAYYRQTLQQCSPDTVISVGTYFSRQSASVGRNVSIGSYCVIGRADIGERTEIGSHVQIPSGRHEHTRGEDGQLTGSGGDRVCIGANCWIGTSAVILADVGAGSTIGAGSVVTKPIAPGVVAAGNPARVLRTADGGGTGMNAGAS